MQIRALGGISVSRTRAGFAGGLLPIVRSAKNLAGDTDIAILVILSGLGVFLHRLVGVLDVPTASLRKN